MIVHHSPSPKEGASLASRTWTTWDRWPQSSLCFINSSSIMDSINRSSRFHEIPRRLPQISWKNPPAFNTIPLRSRVFLKIHLSPWFSSTSSDRHHVLRYGLGGTDMLCLFFSSLTTCNNHPLKKPSKTTSLLSFFSNPRQKSSTSPPALVREKNYDHHQSSS